MAAEEIEEKAESKRDHLRVRLLLRVGLALSVLLMLAGLAGHVARGGAEVEAVPLFDIFAPRDPALVLATLGILALALTPAFRVLALVVIWWRERDWRFVGIALTVTVTLALAMIAGRAG